MDDRRWTMQLSSIVYRPSSTEPATEFRVALLVAPRYITPPPIAPPAARRLRPGDPTRYSTRSPAARADDAGHRRADRLSQSAPPAYPRPVQPSPRSSRARESTAR